MQQTKNPINRLAIPCHPHNTTPRLHQEPGWRGFAPGSQVSIERPPNPLLESYKLYGLDVWGQPLYVEVPYRVLYQAVMYGFVCVVD